MDEKKLTKIVWRVGFIMLMAVGFCYGFVGGMIDETIV